MKPGSKQSDQDQRQQPTHRKGARVKPSFTRTTYVDDPHMNLASLGKLMSERKEELKADTGMTPYDEMPSFVTNGAEKRASLWDRITSATTPSASR